MLLEDIPEMGGRIPTNYVEDILPKEMEKLQKKYDLSSEAVKDMYKILDDALCFAYLKGGNDLMIQKIQGYQRRIKDLEETT